MDTWKTTIKASTGDSAKLAKILKILGVECEMEFNPKRATTDIVLTLPEAYEAEKKATRNAGRHKQAIYPPTGSPFNYDTLVSDFLDWEKDHSTEECMSALGIKSKATYYRKLKEMRERLESTNHPESLLLSYI